MPKNRLENLYNHLFEVTERLIDQDIDFERAKAVSQVCQVIVNVAKVEIAFSVQIGRVQSSFFSADPNDNFSRELPGYNDEVNKNKLQLVNKTRPERTSYQKEIIEFLQERNGQSRIGIIASDRSKTIGILQKMEQKGLIVCVERPVKLAFSSERVDNQTAQNCGIWKLAA